MAGPKGKGRFWLSWAAVLGVVVVVGLVGASLLNKGSSSGFTATSGSGSSGSTTAAGDLGIRQPISNLDCTGNYITILASVVKEPYGAQIDKLLAKYPDANYQRNDLGCPAVNQFLENGGYIYAVYYGPYASAREACIRRAQAPADAYVKLVQPDQKGIATVCVCADDLAAKPALRNGQSPSTENRLATADVQRLLNRVNSKAIKVDGKFGPQTAGAVATFQANAGLAKTGRVDSRTWSALLKAACS